MTLEQQGGDVQPPDHILTPGLRNAVKALKDPSHETFSRAQVAWLMAHAMRWGYENRVAEENANYPPPKVFTVGRWYDQATERARADAAARLPRPNDFRGRTSAHRAAA